MSREEETIQMEKIAVENRQLRDSIKHLALELEEKNRELAIEAALDRVQAKSMAMHSSKDISGAIVVVFKELRKLGIDFERCGVAFFNDTPIIEVWSTPLSPDNDEIVEVVVGHLDATIHPNLQGAHKAWSDKEDYYTYELVGEEVKKYYDLLEKVPDYRFPKISEYPERQISNNFFFNEGQIFFYQKEPLAEDTKRILTRFTHVFSRTYRRYLDIVRAEAQTREAQIEGALERVRAKAMAMHSSKDIPQATVVVFNELRKLGIEIERCGIVIFNDTPVMEVWSTPLSPENDEIVEVIVGHVDTTIHPLLHGAYKAWSDKKDYYTYELVGEEVKKYYDLLEKVPDYRFPKISEYPERQIINSFSFNEGQIFIYQRKPLSEDTKQILSRFTHVFSRTYQRYLDIVRAEAQAREAHVQLAMERVRARTMSMQKSEELAEVAGLLFKQVSELGIKVWTTGFNVWSDDNNYYTDYITSPQGDFIAPYTIDATGFPAFKEVSDARKRDEEFFVSYLEGEMLKETYLQLSKFGDEQQYEKMLEGGFQFPSRQFNHFVFGSKVSLLFITYEPVPEAHDIFKRFGKVFEQTYTRFLDLQKAEAQTREVKIEMALEKVRTQSMAMHKSEDLAVVVSTVFKELEKLEVKTLRCGIGIINETKRSVKAWITTSTSVGNTIGVSGDEPLSGHPLLNTIFINWKAQKSFAYILEGIDLVDYYKAVGNTGFQEDFAKEVLSNLDVKHFYYCVMFPSGGIFTFSEISFSESTFHILKRFADTFHQAYKRFEDLQKAEAQAREAIKQASLDRVRGEIASMRATEDLQRITPLVWHELTVLGVPFFRCGVFIVDETQEIVHFYLSTPDGHSLGVLDLPFGINDTTLEVVDHWRKDAVYQAFWNREQFVTWMQSLVERHRLQNAVEYQGAETPPESLYLNFIPFKQGMLYVGSTDELTFAEIDLVQTLASAFSIAYARYEDFKQLEEAKASVEATLDKLKATQAQLIQSEKMASLGELTAGIAHEIQNPLNFVNNYSEVNLELVEELREEFKKGKLEDVEALIADLADNEAKIHHHGQRAEAIVRGMLQHSRTHSGTREPTNLNALADEYLRLAYHGLRAKDGTFEAEYSTDFDESLPLVEVVPQDMGRVLLNVINNAFQAVAERKQIEPTGYIPQVKVATRKKGQRIELTVQDNGNGIPEVIMDKIFQPFFTTKPPGQGTGLGLSLAYDSVRAQGGTLKVESKVGEGSVFILGIPVGS